MRIRLALGALSNKHFDNALFPLRTPHDEYLPRYSEVLDAFEVDALHHQPRMPEDMQRWLQQAPEGFTFLPKIWKQATHPEGDGWGDEQLDAARTALDGMLPVLDSDHAGPVVVQMSPSFDHTPDHLSWLDDLLDLERPGTFVIEFRHPSWNDEDVRGFLVDRSTQVVWSTHPKAPQVDWTVGDVGVVRLAGPYFPGKKTRGRPITVADRLEDILDLKNRLKTAPWRQCFVTVLNPFEGNAIDSLPRVAGALVDPELGRRLTRKPGEPLFRHPPGGPMQTGLGGFGA